MLLGNLGRVDFINDYEYDLFIRPDTCNPRYRYADTCNPRYRQIGRIVARTVGKVCAFDSQLIKKCIDEKQSL